MQKELRVPTKEEFGAWKHSGVGEWWFDWTRQMFNKYAEELALGQTVNDESIESTAIRTIRHSARAGILYELFHVANRDYICDMLGIDVDTPEEEEENGE